MARTPEATFFDWLKRSFPWQFQRIETTTGIGVPDLWVCHRGFQLWIELKAAPNTNVQIRKSQYAWITRMQWQGIRTWIFNRDPKRKEVILAWCPHFEVEEGRKDFLKITSQPKIALPAKEFARLPLHHFYNKE